MVSLEIGMSTNDKVVTSDVLINILVEISISLYQLTL